MTVLSDQYHDLFNSRISIRHLIIALAVREAGSTVRAAESLHITQPSITRALRELETALGAPLFARTSRGMVPSASAQVFFEHAGSSLDHIQTAKIELEKLTSGAAGELRLGAHVTGTNLLMPLAMSEFKKSFPHVTLTVEEGTPTYLRHQLASGKLDLVISRISNEDETVKVSGETLSTELLLEDSIAIVATPAMAQSLPSPLHLKNLVELPWIVPVQETALLREIESAFRLANVPFPENTVEVAAPATVQSLLRQGNFIATLPLTIARTVPDLQVLRVDGFHVRSLIGLVWSDDHPSNVAAQEFSHLLRAAATEIES